MTLEETKLRALSGLKDRKANISVSFGDLKDENFKKYKFGEITLYQFIDCISEQSPYYITETFNNNYLIIDRRTRLPPQSFLDPSIAKNILSEDMRPKLISTFPELKDFIEKAYTDINSSGCTGCARNSKIHAVIQEMLFLDNKNRDFSHIEAIFGERFISALRSFPPQVRSINKTSQISNTQLVGPSSDSKTNSSGSSSTSCASSKFAIDEDRKLVQKIRAQEQENINHLQRAPIGGGPRPSCIECCMKHIGTAIVLMEEAGNGYPSHRWIAAGELNEAANEMLRDFPEIASEIRDIRHLVTKDINKSPDIMMLLDRLDKKFFR